MATAPFQLWIEMAPVASAVRVGSTVTITTSSAHGFTTGADIQVESVTGSAGTSMNGVYAVTVTSGTTFTYTAAGSAGTGVVTAAAISYDLFNPLIDYAAANRQSAIYAFPDSLQMSATGDGSGASLSFTVAQDDTPAEGPWYTLIPDEARVRLVKANTGTTPAADKSDLFFVSSIRGITARLNGSGQGTIADIDLVDPTAQLDRLVSYGTNASAKYLTIGGAVRSSNVVTFTTAAQHGFVVGDYVNIRGVNGGGGQSFNTRVQVATVPSPTTFTAAQTGSDATGNTVATPTAAQFITGSKQNVFYTVPSNHGFRSGDSIKISGVSHTNAQINAVVNGILKVSGVSTTTVIVQLPIVVSSITGSFAVVGASLTPLGQVGIVNRAPSVIRPRIKTGTTDADNVKTILRNINAYKFDDYALQRIINTGDETAIIGTTSTVATLDRRLPTDTVRSQLDAVLEAMTGEDGKQRRYWVNASGQLALQVVDVTAKPAYATAPYKIITSGAGTPNTITTAATVAPYSLELTYDHQTTKNIILSVANETTDTEQIFQRNYIEAGYSVRPNAPKFDEIVEAPTTATSLRLEKVVDLAAKTYFLERREPILSASFRLIGAGTASHNNLGFSAGYAFLNLGTISSANASGSTVTITMATAHGLASGAQVIIAGITGGNAAVMNGTFTCTVTTTTAFTYTSPGGAGSGTVTSATAHGAKLVSKWEPGQWVDVSASELGLSGLYRVEKVDWALSPGSFMQQLEITINRTPTRTMTALLKKRIR